MMGAWIQQNWDKLLFIFVSIILSAIIGFFSAIISLKSEIHNLTTQIEVTKVRIEEAILPRLKDVESYKNKIDFLDKEIAKLVTTSEFLDSKPKT